MNVKTAVVFLLSIFISAATMAQSDIADTTAPYQKTDKLPTFNLKDTNDGWYDVYNSNKEKNTAIVVFNTTCHHCELEAEEFAKNIDKLNHIDFLWISTSDTKEDILNFASKYGFDKKDNFKFFLDPNFASVIFYDIRTTPFIAVYDNKGKLKKIFRNAVKTEGLLTALKN